MRVAIRRSDLRRAHGYVPTFVYTLLWEVHEVVENPIYKIAIVNKGEKFIKTLGSKEGANLDSTRR